VSEHSHACFGIVRNCPLSLKIRVAAAVDDDQAPQLPDCDWQQIENTLTTYVKAKLQYNMISTSADVLENVLYKKYPRD
jgi:hypothetical protein